MPDPSVCTQAVKKILSTEASSMFMAILDFSLSNPNPRTFPEITALTVTSDGFLMSWNTDHPFKEGFVSHVSDFERNLSGICSHCSLTPDEAEAVTALAWTRITDWRPDGRKGIDPYPHQVGA